MVKLDRCCSVPRLSGQPQSLKDVFFPPEILKIYSDIIRAAWEEDSDGHEGDRACWQAPGMDGISTGGPHYPLLPWKRARPLLPFPLGLASPISIHES